MPLPWLPDRAADFCPLPVILIKWFYKDTKIETNAGSEWGEELQKG